MEELPDFEDAYTMDARVMEQVVIFQRYLLFVAHFIALPFSCCQLFSSLIFTRSLQVLQSFVSSVGLDNEYMPGSIPR